MSYSLHNLDILMLEYINYNNGVFIEAGANDGVSQSNTCYYERNMNWTGLLVEPNPIKYSQCKLNRPKSIVENYALVSSNFKNKTISGDFSHYDVIESLMSMVVDDGDYQDDNLLYHKNKKITENEIIEVPAITIDKLLNDHNILNVDFFSLDVEGYEISVLNGMNFYNIRPKYLLIETANKENYQKTVRGYMKDKNYSFVTQLSGNDDLFVDNTIE
jgi:FkbM family methyltransferase